MRSFLCRTMMADKMGRFVVAAGWIENRDRTFFFEHEQLFFDELLLES